LILISSVWVAISPVFRLRFGLADEETIGQIRENAYMQFTLGFAGYHEVDTGNQISLDDLDKPADWPEGKNWGTLAMDASCTPANITHPTDLKPLNEARESNERILNDLYDQHPGFHKLRLR
jgi:hypothetical protein